MREEYIFLLETLFCKFYISFSCTIVLAEDLILREGVKFSLLNERMSSALKTIGITCKTNSLQNLLMIAWLVRSGRWRTSMYLRQQSITTKYCCFSHSQTLAPRCFCGSCRRGVYIKGWEASRVFSLHRNDMSCKFSEYQSKVSAEFEARPRIFNRP